MQSRLLFSDQDGVMLNECVALPVAFAAGMFIATISNPQLTMVNADIVTKIKGATFSGITRYRTFPGLSTSGAIQ